MDVCGGGERPTREYFVLEGRASASSSWRKEWNSFSAISSLERGFEGAASGTGWGGDGTLSFRSGGKVDEGVVEEDAGVDVDHSQPILRYRESD